MGRRRAACRRAQPRARRLGILVAGASLVFAARASAQSPARSVLLRIRPQVGDTLYTRFEQDVEMIGTTRVHGVDTTMTLHTSMLLLSHVLVQAVDETGTTVTTVTDSLALHADGGAPAPESSRRAMEGLRVQLHIAPDGAASVVDFPAALSPDIRAVISGMPATLPAKPVSVGQTWRRVTAIPIEGRSDPNHAATLRAQYRLDSLSADGGVAYVSMRGTLVRDSSASAPTDRLRVTTQGIIAGIICVDRRRGWWNDAQATITLKSTLVPMAGGSPMYVETRIVQRMRTGAEP